MAIKALSLPGQVPVGRRFVGPTAVLLLVFPVACLAQAGSPTSADAGASGATVQPFALRPPQFTAEQVARGKAAYAASCAACHGADLNGSGTNPALVGPIFRQRWHDLSPDGLFGYIAGQMPLNAPGSLDPKAYSDLATYIFQANGWKPGPVAFTPQSESGAERPVLGPVKKDAMYQAAMAAQQAKLSALTPVTDEMLRKPPSGDWLIWRGTYASLGYSPLRQIDRHNARTLQLAWSWTLPQSANEITPIAHDGVIFIKSANVVEAFDGATGEQLWRYVRHYAPWMHDGRTEIVKNLAVYGHLLYVPFLDGHLLALDDRSGKVVWDHPLVTAAEAASRLPGIMDSSDAQHFLMVADGGPLVAGGEVIVGLAGCSNDYRGGCFIVGLNAQTGQEDWRFNTIARPGELGGDSWNGAPVEQRFGGSVWLSGSYDPDLNLVYFGIGQTYKLSTLLPRHPGADNDALYTDATVALDPKTGRLVWYYQHFPGDVWDLDWAFEQMLVDLPVRGRTQKLVVTAGKIGIFDALERAKGSYAFSHDLGLQNIVTAIDPHTGRKSIDYNLLPKPGDPVMFGSSVCPYARDEPATAYDPTTHVMYVPVLDDSCPDPRHEFDGRYGRLEAFDLVSGKRLWMQRHRAPEISSVLVTGGGVVFDGSMDRNFRASDAATGRVLWQVRLNNAPKAAPITYTSSGRQYVAVVTGGEFENLPRPGMTPESPPPDLATTLWIFALPER
jgi:alcohol dehydrogenase (cytochrome c)